MKRSRTFFATVVLLLVFAAGGTANAAPGQAKLQRLAIEQSQLLFRFYHGQPQTVSPRRCDEGQDRRGTDGIFLLPSLSFGSGDVTLHCRIDTDKVLLDLGGGIATEDARGDTYTLQDGTVLTFQKENLQAICHDAIRFATTPPATLDGATISGTPIVTRDFSGHVNRDADNPPNAPYYSDSKALGHRGRLTACFTGQKTVLKLTPGRHVILVDLSGVAGGPTHVVYDIKVMRPGHRS